MVIDKYAIAYIRRIIKPIYINNAVIVKQENFPKKKQVLHIMQKVWLKCLTKEDYKNNIRDYSINKGLTCYQKNLLNNEIALIGPLENLTAIFKPTLEILEKNHSVKNSISGLMSFTMFQREILNSNEPLSHALRDLICNKMNHIMQNFISRNLDRSLEENLYDAVSHIFLPTNKNDVVMDKNLYNIMGKHLLPLTQSLCVYFFGNSSFQYSGFKKLCDKLDIESSSFENSEIKISNFIELYFCKKLKTIIENSTSFLGEFHLVNKDSLQKIPMFQESESFLKTNQIHCDALILSKNLLNNLKLYIDFKTFLSFNTDQCRFSLFHSNIRSLLIHIADMPIMINNFIQNKTNLKEEINPLILELYNNLLRIKAEKINIKDISQLSRKFERMLSLIVTAFVSPSMQEMNLSFGSNLVSDEHFIIFQEKVLLPYLKNIQQNVEIINNLFPENAVIFNDNHSVTIENFIREFVPPEIRMSVLEYFENIIKARIT